MKGKIYERKYSAEKKKTEREREMCYTVYCCCDENEGCQWKIIEIRWGNDNCYNFFCSF